MKTEAQGSEPSWPRTHCDRDIGLVSEPSSSPLQDLPPSASARSPPPEQSLWCGEGWVVLASVLPSWVCENIRVGGKREGGRGHKGETVSL